MIPPRKGAPAKTTRSSGRNGPAAAPAAPEPSPANAPYGSRPEQVYLRLRDLIVSGQLAPGSRIVETEVSSRLGVSRTPVREALQRLQQEGYVLGTPLAQQSRLIVAPLTRADVHELLNIVGKLEGLAARRAAQRPAADRVDLGSSLRDENRHFHAAGVATPVNHGAIYDADESFHRLIVEAASGPRLLALHQAVKPQAERYIRMYISLLVSNITASVAEHEAIIGAIESGDADAAEAGVETNWRHAADRLSHVIELAGERGSW